MRDHSQARVALVHYWLVGQRGGERVLEALAEMFPQADIFTLVYDPGRTSEILRRHRIQTSFIQRLPWARKAYRSYLPFCPTALEQFDLRQYDLVISSESGPAKGVITAPETCHICYCHSPMRYVWNLYHDYLKSVGPFRRALIPPFMHYVRLWDSTTADRVDHFVANSHNTARRVLKYYRRRSHVIYPPVDVARFKISPVVGSYYLVVSEMVPYKRVDLAVAAFNELGRKLVVVGDGPEAERWRRMAGPNVEFRGRVDNHELPEIYSHCRALIFPGEEDFGLTPVEAQASGRPVIAYGKGGALETVRDGETGILFDEQNVRSLVEAVQRFERNEALFDPHRLRAHAERFDVARFKTEMGDFITGKMAEFAGAASQSNRPTVELEHSTR
ncbi:MAG TPA: glycosyltransferase family 4 protein [Terriglobia bacterium]|nr:glycosyltransferase family 4 protein [Terriglobia bacterium]